MKIQALKSNGGWYIGTLDKDGSPYCRVSTEYWKTRSEAEARLTSNQFWRRNWACRECPFCDSCDMGS